MAYGPYGMGLEDEWPTEISGSNPKNSDTLWHKLSKDSFLNRTEDVVDD